ncbi:MAG: histidinol-phosphatase [Armatimonadetes bacterium]|nr:histidinol-phosphatase [Armatimonadota bacterium]
MKLYETHMHTPLCNHARGEPEEYARAAAALGFQGVIVTCHNPLPEGYSPKVRMRPDQLPEYLALVERARLACAGTVEVRLGLEADYLPGLEDFLRRQLDSAPFDYVLGSVHHHTPEYLERYWTGDSLAFQRFYFEHLAMAAETGLFDCLAHPDLIKNHRPESWNPERLLPVIRSCLDRIAAAGTAMELNTSGRYKTVPEMNPGRPILEEMLARNIPVVVGADAHSPDRVGEGYETAFELLEEVGYRSVTVFLGRRPREIEISACLRPGKRK